MDDALALHRLHFAFTVTYHYLFPQLTMGLALLIFIIKTLALRTGNPASTVASGITSSSRRASRLFAPPGSSPLLQESL